MEESTIDIEELRVYLLRHDTEDKDITVLVAECAEHFDASTTEVINAMEKL